MSDFYVYILRRPSGEPFYVGKGRGRRMHKHEVIARRGDKSLKSSIIRKIWSEGGEVIKDIAFDGLTNPDAALVEVNVIKLIGRRDLGLGPLANSTDGGDGVTGWSEEMRARQSAATKIGMDEEVRRQCSERAKALWSRPEMIAKMSSSCSSFWKNNPDARAAQSLLVKKVLSDPVVSARVNAAKKAGQATPEARMKMRLAKLGKKQSPEFIAKRIAASVASRRLRRLEKAA